MSYRELDFNEFSKYRELARSRATGGQFDYWKPQVGPAGSPRKNVIRIMPAHENMKLPFVETTMHFLPSNQIDPKTQRAIPIGIACLSQWGDDCPACTESLRIRQAADLEDDNEQAAQLKRQASSIAKKIRVYANVVDLDHPEKGVQRYAFGRDIADDLTACFYDDDNNPRDITHPTKGRDVLMYVQKRAGTDFNDYQIRAKESPSPIQDKAWLEQIHDLNELVRKPTRDEVLMALRGERPQAQQRQQPPASSPATSTQTETAAVPPQRGRRRAAAVDEEAEAPAPRSRRQAVTMEEDEPAAQGPYAKAQSWLRKRGFENWQEITVDQAERFKKPPCYTKETDISDAMCQSCALLLPCVTAKEKLG